MSHLSPARWLAALPAITALAAAAQSAPPEPASASASPLPYRSAFEGYRRFQDDKPLPWKEANDTVRQRGGWRAYAREAAGAADEAEGAASPPAPAAPGADPHAGHGGHGAPPASPSHGKDRP